MHLMDGGFMKNTMGRTFNCGTSHQTRVGYKRSSIAQLSELVRYVCFLSMYVGYYFLNVPLVFLIVLSEFSKECFFLGQYVRHIYLGYRHAAFPSDFPRRARIYDHASYKCNEWRQMSLLLFPAILKCLGPDKRHEKSVFMSYSFLSRAMRMPDNEYMEIPEEMIDAATDILNRHYEAAFGPTAGTYNAHIVSSHLKQIREAGPFTNHNAYPFEGMYSDMRRSFVPGTRK